MSLGLVKNVLALVCYTLLFVGCDNLASSVPVNVQHPFNAPSVLAPGSVVYEGSLDGSPGHGQILVWPASLGAHPQNPLRTFMDGAVRPYGEWVTKSGDLYVANTPQGAPTTGVFAYHPGASHPFRNIRDNLGNPTHVAVGNDGTVYVSDNFCPGTPEGACIVVFAPASNEASRTVDLHFSGYALRTGEMAFDKNGNLLVVDTNFKQGAHVFSVDTHTFKVTDLQLEASSDGPGLGVDAAGNLYLSGPGGIDMFPPGSKRATRTLNGFAYDITVLPNGTVYGNGYGAIVEFAPGANNPTNTIESSGNFGLGIAVGPTT